MLNVLMEKIQEEITRMQNNREVNGTVKHSYKDFEFVVVIKDQTGIPKPDIEVVLG